MVGADLDLKALLGVGLGTSHDTGVEDEQVQPWLGGIQVSCQSLHRLQICKIQLLDEDGPLQSCAFSEQIFWPCVKMHRPSAFRPCIVLVTFVSLKALVTVGGLKASLIRLGTAFTQVTTFRMIIVQDWAP